jgi:hypothetical protein
VQEAMTLVTAKTTAWDQEKERERQAEERRLRELARQQEESRRMEEAQARQEESLRLRAEQERLSKIAAEEAAKGRAEAAERACLASEQAALEAEAAAEESEAALNDAVSAPAPVVILQKSTPVVSGISYRDNWAGVCDDLFALVKAIATGQAPLALVQIHQPTLNKLAGAMKQSMKIAGCRAVNNRVQNTRL